MSPIAVFFFACGGVGASRLASEQVQDSGVGATDSIDQDTGGPDDLSDAPTTSGTDQERTGSGAGASDFGRGSLSVTLDAVPWMSQLMSCDWTATRTCGPTAVAMTLAWLDGTDPDDAMVSGLLDDLGQDPPCGDYTNTTMLAGLLDEHEVEYDIAAFDAGSLEDTLLAGHPVIAPVYTQDPATGLMDLASGYGHFMVVVGVTPTTIIAHDPGRSAYSNGAFHSFDIDDFAQAWWENGGFTGIEVEQYSSTTTVTGGFSDCTVDDTRLSVSFEAESDPAPIVLWSVTIDTDGVQMTDTVDTHHLSADASTDVSEYADGASHTAKLWTRTDDGATHEVDTCDFEVEDAEEPEDAEAPYAEDWSRLPTEAGSTSRDILQIVDVDLSDVETDPQVRITGAKADGSAFSGTRTCRIFVGTWESYGVERTSFTVHAGETRFSATASGWPSASSWRSAECDSSKELFLVCDDDAGGTAWWYAGEPAEIGKVCP